MPAAYLVGTISQPEIALSFDFSDVHATTGQPLQQWVKGLPGRRWDRSTSTWRVQCFGAMPTAALREAGIVCDPEAPHPERHESLNGVFDLDELVPPLVLAHETRSIAVVRMRFSGWDRTKRHLPLGAWWDKATQRFEVRLADLVQVDDAGNRSMWPNLIYMPGTAERALAASITEAPTDSSIATVAATAAMSTGLDLTKQAEEAVEALVAAVGEIPEDFTMNLYPYQRLGALAAAAGRGLLADSPGLGKGSPVSTKILTPTGWTTYGDVQVGDQVIGSDGKATTVIGVYPRGELDVYRVTMSDGASVVVDADHLWSVATKAERRTGAHWRTRSTRDLMSDGLTYREGKQTRSVHFIPLVEPVHFADQGPLPLDPYFLGAMLGDGHFHKDGGLSFTCVEEELVELVRDRLPDGITLNPWKSASHERAQSFGVGGRKGVRSSLKPVIKELGLDGSRSWTKHVPSKYLMASPEDRLELLRGLLDTDGHAGTVVEFVTVSEQLAKDVAFLARSLGGLARTSVKQPTYKNRHGEKVNGRPAYRVNLRMPVNPFRVSRKADAWDNANHLPVVRSIRNIEPAGREQVVCIAVDAQDCLYVTEEFIVTHNTRQALAAAALRRSHRTVIVVPPVVVTNWVKETEESSLAKNCHGDIVMFRAGRKEPEFPDRGVVVIPDSLMVSRPHLVQKCIDWQPEVMVYDEAHRARNWTSKRSEVMRSFSEQLPTDTLRIAISGTPLFSQPHELAAILAITGHLDPVFGGYSNFLTEYSRQNHFKAWVAQKKKLPQLRQRLAEHVWVRRLKADVLKDLPPKSRVGVIVDIDLKDYRKAHDEVIEKIVDWLLAFWDEKAQETGVGRWPDEEEKDAWARQQIGLMSPLRKAAGVAKVPVALDMINDWVASNVLDSPAPDGSLYDRPLLVWAHHQEVIAALKDGIAAANKEVQVAVEIIDGATPAATRGAIVDRFQAGKIGVLIASNTAAGVGITLTRGSDMIFVETDWTPAIVSQCEDRCVFAGQPVMTKNGPKLIEDVVPGDVVLTHAGNWRAVTDAWSRSIRTNGYTGKTGRRLKTTISYQGAPFDLMVTNDHEVYAKKADGRIGWFEASTLLPGDYLATPKFKGSGLKSIVFPDRHRRWTSDEIAESRRCSVCGDPTIARGMCGIHYRQWCQQNRLDDGSLPPATGAPNARYTPAPEKIIVDDEFLNFCGWYVAEGFSSGRGKSKGSFVSFSLHEDERHVADRLAKYAERVFGARSSIYTKPTSRGIELRIYSSDLAEWFHAEFGHGARQKSLPSWIFDLDESQVKVFFDAYTQGDGHQRATANGEGRRNSWTTASDTLNDQMVLLAARLGQVPGSTYRAPFDRIIEGRPTSSGSAWVTEYTERDQCDEQVVWRRVSAVSTTTAKRDEKIYDLTVEGDESYVVGWAAVHNCARIGQEQPVICKTLIADDTLDQRIQKVLLTKAKVLNEVLGGTEADVAVAESEEDLVAPAEILLGLLKVAEPKAVKALKERAKAAA